MYDPEHSAIISEAFSRMHDHARAAGSYLGERIIQWIQGVYPTGRPEDAFLNPDSFPVFLLPWYAESSLHPEPNEIFQSDLVYSTLNGYYYIRLIDNLMDGHDTEDLSVLPILNFFSTNFQNPYYKYFENGHPFWEYFNSVWLRSAEASLLDAQLGDIDEDLFVEVSARKTCAAKIPVAAVFFHYEHPSRIQLWERFIDLFGCWHQMSDDTRDFAKDERDDNRTYFLSEAHRRKKSDELVVDWVIREGHEWGMKTLDGWISEMEELMIELDCPKLNEYIHQRKLIFSEQQQEAGRYLMQLEEILASIKAGLEKFEGN
jgi:hypothetical protein